ncbi:MAG: hypothetical protein HZB20_00485, partial [Chloroflexi bacterium]|nr:hypothetical protein [Chloroflexota bacterium]
MTKKLTVSLLLLALLLPFAAPARADAPLRTPHFPLRTLNFALPQWQQLFPPTSPPPRSDVAMTYDARREMAVMFGGYGYPATGGSTTWLDETWEWDSQGQTWAQRFPQHNPPKRDWAAIAYDHARGVSVMFGGFNAGGTLGDTWLWDGDDWTQVFPQHTPLPRRLQSMAYDFRRQVTVMYGGWVFGTQSYTWEWDGADWIAQDIAEPDPWR